jgi:hypothetical protein
MTGPHHRVDLVETGAAQTIHRVDQDNGVVDHNADQQDDADQHHHGNVGTGDEESQHDTDDGHGDGE